MPPGMNKRLLKEIERKPCPVVQDNNTSANEKKVSSLIAEETKLEETHEDEDVIDEAERVAYNSRVRRFTFTTSYGRDMSLRIN